MKPNSGSAFALFSTIAMFHPIIVSKNIKTEKIRRIGNRMRLNFSCGLGTLFLTSEYVIKTFYLGGIGNHIYYKGNQKTFTEVNLCQTPYLESQFSSFTFCLSYFKL